MFASLDKRSLFIILYEVTTIMPLMSQKISISYFVNFVENFCISLSQAVDDMSKGGSRHMLTTDNE